MIFVLLFDIFINNFLKIKNKSTYLNLNVSKIY